MYSITASNTLKWRTICTQSQLATHYNGAPYVPNHSKEHTVVHGYIVSTRRVVQLVSPISCSGGGCVGQAAGQLQHHLVGQPLTHYKV